MKKVDSAFSYRSFLKKAELSGPNFYREVVEGSKNLSPGSAEKFAHALNLSKKESHYFITLVLFNQAKTSKQKQEHFKELTQFEEQTDTYILSRKQYTYLSKWYHLTIREYIHAHQFSDDYETLLDRVTPKISERQARNAVELLEELHFIQKGEDGVYFLTDPILSTEPTIAEIGAYAFYQSILDISKKALDTFKSKDRYFRSMTGSFSEDAAERIKLELDNSRKRIMEIIREDSGDKKVYQVGMQMFPMEKERQRKKKK